MKQSKSSRTATMRGHQPLKGALPCGDYYGTGVKNPLGKTRESQFEPTPRSAFKKTKRTPAA